MLVAKALQRRGKAPTGNGETVLVEKVVMQATGGNPPARVPHLLNARPPEPLLLEKVRRIESAFAGLVAPLGQPASHARPMLLRTLCPIVARDSSTLMTARSASNSACSTAPSAPCSSLAASRLSVAQTFNMIRISNSLPRSARTKRLRGTCYEAVG